jgi:hypothetical protein
MGHKLISPYLSWPHSVLRTLNEDPLSLRSTSLKLLGPRRRQKLLMCNTGSSKAEIVPVKFLFLIGVRTLVSISICDIFLIARHCLAAHHSMAETLAGEFLATYLWIPCVLPGTKATRFLK